MVTEQEKLLLAYGTIYQSILNDGVINTAKKIDRFGNNPVIATIETVMTQDVVPEVVEKEKSVPVEEKVQLETVHLANDDVVEAEVMKETTDGGRSRHFILQEGEKTLVTKKGGQWRQRRKAKRDFSSYKLNVEDRKILECLAEFHENDANPTFMDLAEKLGKTRGQLLGRYRSINGAGYVKRDGSKYVLTEKGRSLLEAKSKKAQRSTRAPRSPSRKKPARSRRRAAAKKN